MWRPKGWKQIKEHRWGDVGLASGMFKSQEIEFEAGADAMLKSLMENSVDDEDNGTWVYSIGLIILGAIVTLIIVYIRGVVR